MKPSLFVPLLLFFLFHGSFTHATTLENICGAVQYFSGISINFCVNSLQADPKSQTASPNELAIISTKLSQDNATSTFSKIGDLLKNTTDPTMKKYLNVCRDSYMTAVVDLNNTIPLITAKAYGPAMTLLYDASSKRYHCRDALGEGDVDPVLKENQDLFELITMSTTLTSFLK